MLNFDTYLIRSSGFHKLMTEPKLKADKEAGNLSQTAKTYLREIFIEKKYKRKKEFESKYTSKGLTEENNGITLYCIVKKLLYKKNVVRFNNDFITGEPDLLNSTHKPSHGVDIKCSWSIWTFPYKDDELSDAYWWQNQCYMALTGATEWSTSFCLVNATASLITNEKKAVWYKMECPDMGDDNYADYIDKCIDIERNMIFNIAEFKQENPGFDMDCKVWDCDIPFEDRVLEFKVTRDEEAINKIEPIVLRARKYLNDLNHII